MYYECHITMEADEPNALRAPVAHIGWLFSAIDGDPNLGNGVKCYATRQFKGSLSEGFVRHQMATAVLELEGMGCKVLRSKIECVVYDTKQVSLSPAVVIDKNFQSCGKFELGDRVTKTKGSNWTGRVVGTYSTKLTPEGYAVESEFEHGSVQIYPASALEKAP